MFSDEEDAVKTSRFERHLQTGIQLILIGLLAWAGMKLVTLGESTAVLRERLIYQGEQISNLRRDLRDWSDVYMKKSDAARDLELINTRIDAAHGRIDTVVGRVDAIEARLK